jgi:hypothetical protein
MDQEAIGNKRPIFSDPWVFMYNSCLLPIPFIFDSTFDQLKKCLSTGKTEKFGELSFLENPLGFLKSSAQGTLHRFNNNRKIYRILLLIREAHIYIYIYVFVRTFQTPWHHFLKPDFTCICTLQPEIFSVNEPWVLDTSQIYSEHQSQFSCVYYFHILKAVQGQ